MSQRTGFTVLAVALAMALSVLVADTARVDTELGEVFWATYDSGDAELSLWALGVAAGSRVELVIDGLALGSFTADEAGAVSAYFATWNGGAIPGGLELARIENVELVVGGTTRFAGSFDEPVRFPDAGCQTAVCQLFRKG